MWSHKKRFFVSSPATNPESAFAPRGFPSSVVGHLGNSTVEIDTLGSLSDSLGSSSALVNCGTNWIHVGKVELWKLHKANSNTAESRTEVKDAC